LTKALLILLLLLLALGVCRMWPALPGRVMGILDPAQVVKMHDLQELLVQLEAVKEENELLQKRTTNLANLLSRSTEEKDACTQEKTKLRTDVEDCTKLLGNCKRQVTIEQKGKKETAKKQQRPRQHV